MEPGRLIVCPTPIGNLEDVTLRVLTVLRDADVIACEDTRHSRRLLDRYSVTTPLISYHEHNERSRADDLVARMQGGQVVALVSDAGMPLVSDPGAVLVSGCIAAQVVVEVLPGPSAVLVALAVSGLSGERWRFVGFLPRKAGELRTLLTTGAAETLVAFESPRRIGASLAVLAQLSPDRPAAICRELTKVYEEVVRGTAAGLAARYADHEVRGEIVLVVGPDPGAGDDEDPDLGPALAALRDLVAAGAKPRPAAKAVASLTGASANALYRALTEARTG